MSEPETGRAIVGRFLVIEMPRVEHAPLAVLEPAVFLQLLVTNQINYVSGNLIRVEHDADVAAPAVAWMTSS
ncbi:hypothetical protein ACTJJ7_23800 [Phyllobacterium sp. 22229]|uniref:hypothetical protein n=1 Tax=Phyllobacterium sp. 22229 TaxID=3453895 RepID=UPI003F874C0B